MRLWTGCFRTRPRRSTRRRPRISASRRRRLRPGRGHRRWSTSAGAQVLAARANDGAAASVTDAGGAAAASWQPTGPVFAPAATPQFASVAPFGPLSPGQFAAVAPPAIGSAAFAAAANQTDSLGALNSTTRSAAETQQALFFNDPVGTDTPAGQWNQIAATVAQSSGESLASDALLFAELNVAEADLAIATASNAFADNTPAPVTLLTNPNLASLNPAISASPGWTSLLATPDTPGYPEALGAFGGAAAAVLGGFFGTGTAFTATSESDPGVTLPFTSFSTAASDAAMSQVYGGTAFSFSATAGLALGTSVGTWTEGLFSATAIATPIVVLTTANGGATNQAPTITGSVSNAAGVSALDARLPGGSTVVVPLNAAGGFSFTVPEPSGGTGDGTQVVSFTAIDTGGTQSPSASFTFSLFTQAPTLTFTANSVTNTGTIGANAVLAGSVGLEPGIRCCRCRIRSTADRRSRCWSTRRPARSTLASPTRPWRPVNIS